MCWVDASVANAATRGVESALASLNVFNINKPNLIAPYNLVLALFSRIQCGE